MKKGSHHTPEARAKLSAARMGVLPWNTGLHWSEEIRKKISDAHKGKKMSPEFCLKMAKAQAGRKHSEETRRKISEGNRGERNGMWGKTPPHKGMPASPESRAKVSAANKGRLVGSKNPQWRGGVSYEPYCIKFSDEFKERVREFFGRQCVECGAVENGAKLDVHHVNFRKDSCCAEDVAPLFVPLCRSCHGKTTHNREYYEARFTALISDEYGGRCYLPKQEAPSCAGDHSAPLTTQ